MSTSKEKLYFELMRREVLTVPFRGGFRLAYMERAQSKMVQARIENTPDQKKVYTFGYREGRSHVPVAPPLHAPLHHSFYWSTVSNFGVFFILMIFFQGGSRSARPKKVIPNVTLPTSCHHRVSICILLNRILHVPDSMM